MIQFSLSYIAPFHKNSLLKVSYILKWSPSGGGGGVAEQCNLELAAHSDHAWKHWYIFCNRKRTLKETPWLGGTFRTCFNCNEQISEKVALPADLKLNITWTRLCVQDIVAIVTNWVKKKKESYSHDSENSDFVRAVAHEHSNLAFSKPLCSCFLAVVEPALCGDVPANTTVKEC